MISSFTSRSPVWFHQKTALLTESFQLDTESLRNLMISAQLLIESKPSTNSCHFWQPQQKGQTPKSAWGLHGSFSPEVASQWAVHYPGRAEIGKTCMATLWTILVPRLRGGHFSSCSIGSLFIEKEKYRKVPKRVTSIFCCMYWNKPNSEIRVSTSWGCIWNLFISFNLCSGRNSQWPE